MVHGCTVRLTGGAVRAACDQLGVRAAARFHLRHAALSRAQRPLAFRASSALRSSSPAS